MYQPNCERKVGVSISDIWSTSYLTFYGYGKLRAFEIGLRAINVSVDEPATS
jgi:hypothetical protein